MKGVLHQTLNIMERKIKDINQKRGCGSSPLCIF